ncbi:hypothetical protein AB1Y20_021221 [Prymnesium parvum]|uniref:RCC1-like domain-containing protein n=1 Tax=Prymnesium parvum TaxID=97485 RepID=A0AB34JK14_PRYPA
MAAAPPASGKVYSAGSTRYGATGTGCPSAHARARAPSLVLPLLELPVLHVACGWRHTMFATLDGAVWACGEGVNGKLGLDGPAEVERAPRRVDGLHGVRVVQLSCGQHHTGFVSADGALFTCGMGLYGQCGHGDLHDELVPRKLKSFSRVAAVSCGSLHTLALRHDGKVFGFGFAANGRLGIAMEPGNERAVVESPTRIDLGGVSGGTAKGVCVVALSAGGGHSGMISDDGNAWTCGTGELGQLGHGSTVDEAHPKCIQGMGEQMMLQISCGAAHTIFLTRAGTVFTCGCGGMGRTGLDTRQKATVPQMVASLSAQKVVQVSAGYRHSMFITQSGEVFVCGDNSSGQLGASTSSRSILLPTSISKFSKGKGMLLGASCGGEHSIFLVDQVVNTDDIRAEQLDAAATVVQQWVRGSLERRRRR